MNAPSLKHLLGEVFSKNEMRLFTESIMGWLESATGASALKEAETLVELLPATSRPIGLRGGVLRNRILQTVRELAEEVCERYTKYTETMELMAAAADYGKAKHWQRMRDDYMGQFLVTYLSRRGLIPTYSFPVHSLTLEVIADSNFKNFSKSDVALSRDASQGISEYAPGAQVVANGRLWESAGLAHFPKAFMPERFYTACTECFHVDIGDLPDEIPPACSNCGNTDGRRKRRFLEPQGFVTSYAQHRGRDPGMSRLRAKPADEAKLIAAPRDDVFEATDLSFLRTALLTAKSEDGALSGSLFIANRGVYGEGYYRCNLCNFSKPIEKANATPAPGTKGAGKAKLDAKVVHDNPMSGNSCPNVQISRRGLDFVHRFHTDVRLFRFLPAMPAPSAENLSPRRFHERFARTISEALRLAAIDLLHLYPGEVRAIYRLYGNEGGRLEVVLYDGVPGGAGYCARLGGANFSLTQLMTLARERLNCDSACESGCRSCLCDYGNQRYWNSFERKAAHDWLNSLLEPVDHASGPSPYVSWVSPSLAGLSQRIKNYEDIHLIARTLVDSEQSDDTCLKQLVTWMLGGKKVHIYLSSKLEIKPKQKSALMVYRMLSPFLLDGKLTLYALPHKAELDWTDLPRAFSGTAIGDVVVRQPFALEPLMRSIVSDPAEIGVVDEALQAMLHVLTMSSTPYEKTSLQEGSKLVMHELSRGQARDLSAIFSPVVGAVVKRLTIYDPYCGAQSQQNRLEEFIKGFRTQFGTPERFEIVCKETKDRDGYVEHYLDVEMRLDKLLESKGFQNRDVRVVQLKSGVKNFHDRQIDVLTVSSDGCDELHRFFLTGGVDYLMDTNAETKVFYIAISM